MGDANEEGWQPGYLDLWLQFLGEKGGKGVSKDTWNMVRILALHYSDHII